MEVPIYHSLQEAIAAGLLQAAPDARDREPFVTEDLPDDAGAMFQVTDEGRCVFFDRRDHLCIVHRDLGEEALASTCRHFPRVAVVDRRGTSITLSHFCPTAASMLFRDDVPVQVVEAPPAFPPSDYEGLIVEPDAFPPLLTPWMLMDLEGYDAWEHHMVAAFADVDRSPEEGLATLARDARTLAAWKPGVTSLADAVTALPRDRVGASPTTSLAPSMLFHRDVVAAMPEDLRPDSDEADLERAYVEHVWAAWPAFARPLNRYLAAKAFASWTAYQGRGIATIVRGLEAALAVVRVEAARECRNAGHALDAALLLQAFRSADFALNHLAVGEDLCAAWAVAERM